MEDVIAVTTVGLAMVLLASGSCYYMVMRALSFRSGNQQTLDTFEGRIQNIEARLSDIQNIVLSIDDQLKRTPTSTPNPSVKELS